jgi:hypothetical protein
LARIGLARYGLAGIGLTRHRLTRIGLARHGLARDGLAGGRLSGLNRLRWLYRLDRLRRRRGILRLFLGTVDEREARKRDDNK